MKPLKNGRANTYSRPLASKSGGAFALRALQLVPPLIVTTPSNCPRNGEDRVTSGKEEVTFYPGDALHSGVFTVTRCLVHLSAVRPTPPVCARAAPRI